MLYLGKRRCIREKEVVFGRKRLDSCKKVVFEQNRLYLGKSCCIRGNCCIRAKWLYLGKSGCILARVVVFW